jgi:probable F420-dependent oxidoreductase
MKFSLILNTVGSDIGDYVALTQKAEEAGFDSVLVGDHVAMPARLEAGAPYTRNGKSPMDFRTQWPDCLGMMMAMAAATSRIRVISSVLVLPLRHPVNVARMLSTMAVVAPGRVVLGVGAGWLREEFDILGAPFESRGARLDEQIDILRILMRDGEIEWQGAEFDIPLLSVLPRPERPIPIHIGGEAAPALRRAANRGDGYISVLRRGQTLVDLAARLRTMRAQGPMAGHNFEFIATVADARTADDFARLHAQGIDCFAVLPWKAPYEQGEPPFDEKIAAMERFGQDVIARLP